MKPNSTNSPDFLSNYILAQKKEKFPDGLLSTGVLLSGTLLAIYCLVAGMLVFVTLVCVLIVGAGLGVLKHYGPYTILSTITGDSLASLKRETIPATA